MRRTGLYGSSKKMKKIYREIEEENPSLRVVTPLFQHRGQPFRKIEVLALCLNYLAPDSSARAIAELLERMLTEPLSKENWVRQDALAPIIGATPYTPAPGSPLYTLNKFLERNPLILRIEGYGANDNVEISATHIPIPALTLIPGVSDELSKALAERMADTNSIVTLLWEIFLRKEDLGRLRKCVPCGTWFVDRTKNRSKQRCSDRCTWQHWSWNKRKEAHHKLARKKQKAEKA